VENQPPVEVVNAEPSVGRLPLKVQFSADGSYDSEGDFIAFEWDFGDGSKGASGAETEHVHTERGTYIARLTVTDNDGMTGEAQVEIKVRKSRRGRKLGSNKSVLIHPSPKTPQCGLAMIASAISQFHA